MLSIFSRLICISPLIIMIWFYEKYPYKNKKIKLKILKMAWKFREEEGGEKKTLLGTVKPTPFLVGFE